ncbi:DUF6455 family protein [Stappia indica]|uniref:DUF6455 family protein n=1 Tax=Stappia indica TaxID=538381 RepID=UPI001CD2C18B|nr:DUF6455 family protein [Stappia indica]MCA1300409.1 DUF6455 family protein [Stappia indica]
MGILQRMDERATLMGRMMRTVGADTGMPADMGLGLALHSAAQKCLGCDRPQECAGWLDAHQNTGADHAPDYCPNADLFADWSGHRAK